MQIARNAFAMLAAVTLIGCGSGALPTEVGQVQFKPGNGDKDKVTGSFAANFGASVPIIGEFELSAQIKKDGTPSGHFSFRAETTTGVIEFTGAVTCLSVDHALSRVWIGAVITSNASTRVSFMGPVHQPGHDVWFRVADRSPGGSGDPDRTTFLGFEGAIPTSAAYCAMRIWPNDAVATVSGNLTVH